MQKVELKISCFKINRGGGFSLVNKKAGSMYGN